MHLSEFCRVWHFCRVSDQSQTNWRLVVRSSTWILRKWELVHCFLWKIAMDFPVQYLVTVISAVFGRGFNL